MGYQTVMVSVKKSKMTEKFDRVIIKNDNCFYARYQSKAVQPGII